MWALPQTQSLSAREERDAEGRCQWKLVREGNAIQAGVHTNAWRPAHQVGALVDVRWLVDRRRGGETWLWRASPGDVRRTDTGRRWEASCEAVARNVCLSGRENGTGRGRRGPGASVYRRWIRRRFWRGERRAWCGLFTRGVELGAGGDGDRRAKEVRRLYCGLRIGGETTCMHPRRGERSLVWCGCRGKKARVERA